MVKSMTGFGKSEVTLPNRKITVEIRSLNSKQMDLSLRLPAIYRQSEYEIRNAVARALRRGKVDVFVSVESQAVETSAHINGQVLAAYAGELREAAREAGFDTTAPDGTPPHYRCSCAFPTRCPPTRRASPRRSTPHCCGPSRKPAAGSTPSARRRAPS